MKRAAAAGARDQLRDADGAYANNSDASYSIRRRAP